MRKIDRFDMYMKYKGLNDNQVSLQLGLSNGVIGKSRKDGRDISRRVLEQIEKYYPDLNISWIYTGEGEMLKNAPITREDAARDGYIISPDAMKIFLNMSNTISRQEENISKLTDMVVRLTGDGIKKDAAGFTK